MMIGTVPFNIEKYMLEAFKHPDRSLRRISRKMPQKYGRKLRRISRRMGLGTNKLQPSNYWDSTLFG